MYVIECNHYINPVLGSSQGEQRCFSATWGFVVDWLAFVDSDLECEEVRQVAVPVPFSSGTHSCSCFFRNAGFGLQMESDGRQIRWGRQLAATAIHDACWESLYQCFGKVLKVPLSIPPRGAASFDNSL